MRCVQAGEVQDEAAAVVDWYGVAEQSRGWLRWVYDLVMNRVWGGYEWLVRRWWWPADWGRGVGEERNRERSVNDNSSESSSSSGGVRGEGISDDESTIPELSPDSDWSEEEEEDYSAVGLLINSNKSQVSEGAGDQAGPSSGQAPVPRWNEAELQHMTTEVARLEHEGFVEACLMNSGDVEENPGPMVRQNKGQGDLLIMFCCAMVLMVLGLEQVGLLRAGEWWKSWALGTLGVYGAAMMLTAATPWTQWATGASGLEERKMKAKQRREQRKARRRREEWETQQTGLMSSQRRFRKRWCLPGVMATLWGLLLLMWVSGAVVMRVNAMQGKGDQLQKWSLESATVHAEGRVTSAEAAGAAWVETSGEALLPGLTAAARTHPAYALKELDPLGDKEVSDEAETVFRDPEGQFQFANNPAFSEACQEQLRQAVRSRKHAFAYSMDELPGYKEPVSWQLKTNKPIRVPCHSRKFSPVEYEIMDEKVKELEAARLVIEVDPTAAYAAMPVIAAKKNAITGLWSDHRFCVNYIPLNAQMMTNNYAAPLPEQIFEAARGCTVFGTIDLTAGFHQLVPTPECQEHLCFWHRRRLMKFTRLPFGIKNALPLFQQVVDKVLAEGGCSDCAVAYVDDILIMSRSPEEHVQHVAKVLDCLYAVGLRAHPAKSCFGSSQLEFIGHMLGKQGELKPTVAKVAAIQALPEPQNVSQLKHVMGIISYYRCYIPNAGAIAAPINELTKQGVTWKWGSRQQRAFEVLKQALMSEPVLQQPVPSRQFILHTDWSGAGIGAVLAQQDDEGREYMVACVSRSLNAHERNYTPWKGELLACVYGVKMFRHYLHGRQFQLVTDHRPLLGLLTTAEPNSQQSRWLMALQEHEFTVKHRPGVLHVNADVLSRWPRGTQKDVSGVRVDSGPVVSPVLPSVVIDRESFTGAEAACQQGEDLAGKLQEQWKSVKAAQADVQIEEQCNLVEELGAVGGIEAFAPDAGYFLEALSCQAIEVEPPSILQQEDWELLQVVQDSVNKASSCWSDSQGTVAGGGGIDTSNCADTFFPWCYRAGLVVFEPFGGLGAGLEMALRMGCKVRRYMYADKSSLARRVMEYRLMVLSSRYPELLPPSAWKEAFSGPQDVYEWSEDTVRGVVRKDEQWLMIAGWECQDLSAAGSGQGLRGAKSGSYFQMVEMLKWLQTVTRECGNPPVGYVIENTAFQFNWKEHQVSVQDFATVGRVMGQPVVIDAARFGSRAHRLRNFWTNLQEPRRIAAAVQQAERPAGRLVQDVLGEGREAMPVETGDCWPWYECNKVGETRRVWPTLMAFRQSYNFRPGKAGAVWDDRLGRFDEPTAQERERALGYHEGDTAAPGVSEEDRKAVLGRCIDANAMIALFAISRNWWELQGDKMQCMVVAGYDDQAEAAGTVGVAACLADATPGSGGKWEASVWEQREVYEDKGLMHWLTQQEWLPGMSSKDKDRVQHRIRRLRLKMERGVLKRKMGNGRWCTVPTPEERRPLVLEMHVKCGHYGRKRMMSLLQHSYWWVGMGADVRAVVQECTECDRARVSFAGLNPVLQSLPVQGLFYRWHVDLATRLPQSVRGNTCVMVMVDAFSKLVEVHAMPEKTPEHTSRGFREQVLGRYGAPAQVVTDRGPEFEGDWADMLVEYMIDHTPTTAGSPQGNGQVERVVQVVKRSLKKMCEADQCAKEWEKHLPNLVLGYNASVQSATGYAPYTLVFGVTPVLPAARRERLSAVLDVTNVESAAQELLQRQRMMAENAVMAGGNLLIAQRRDQLAYARKRDGTYLPRVKVFKEGDYVYVRGSSSCIEGSGLVLAVEPRILRVTRANDNGTVEVIGRDGARRVFNSRNLTLCHHPDIDDEIDWTLSKPSPEFPCSQCGSTLDWGSMLLCDGCGKGYHLWCSEPPLREVPVGSYICGECRGRGVTQEAVDQREERTEQQKYREEQYREFRRQANPTAAQKRQEAQNASMHGRLVKRVSKGRVQWGKIWYLGGEQPDHLR